MLPTDIRLGWVFRYAYLWDWQHREGREEGDKDRPCLVLAIVQVGPNIVMLPLIAWVWFTYPALHALLFTVYTAPLLVLDNVLRPILMARGLQTPMSVILAGVICGTVSGGLIGLFVGPVVLAVFYDLVMSWMAEPEGEATTSASS